MLPPQVFSSSNQPSTFSGSDNSSPVVTLYPFFAASVDHLSNTTAQPLLLSSSHNEDRVFSSAAQLATSYTTPETISALSEEELKRLDEMVFPTEDHVQLEKNGTANLPQNVDSGIGWQGRFFDTSTIPFSDQDVISTLSVEELEALEKIVFESEDHIQSVEKDEINSSATHDVRLRQKTNAGKLERMAEKIMSVKQRMLMEFKKDKSKASFIVKILRVWKTHLQTPTDPNVSLNDFACLFNIHLNKVYAYICINTYAIKPLGIKAMQRAEQEVLSKTVFSEAERTLMAQYASVDGQIIGFLRAWQTNLQFAADKRVNLKRFSEILNVNMHQLIYYIDKKTNNFKELGLLTLHKADLLGAEGYVFFSQEERELMSIFARADKKVIGFLQAWQSNLAFPEKQRIKLKRFAEILHLDIGQVIYYIDKETNKFKPIGLDVLKNMDEAMFFPKEERELMAEFARASNQIEGFLRAWKSNLAFSENRRVSYKRFAEILSVNLHQLRHYIDSETSAFTPLGVKKMSDLSISKGMPQALGFDEDKAMASLDTMVTTLFSEEEYERMTNELMVQMQHSDKNLPDLFDVERELALLN